VGRCPSCGGVVGSLREVVREGLEQITTLKIYGPGLGEEELLLLRETRSLYQPRPLRSLSQDRESAGGAPITSPYEAPQLDHAPTPDALIQGLRPLGHPADALHNVIYSVGTAAHPDTRATTTYLIRSRTLYRMGVLDSCRRCGGGLREDVLTGLRICGRCGWGFTVSGRANAPHASRGTAGGA